MTSEYVEQKLQQPDTSVEKMCQVQVKFDHGHAWHLADAIIHSNLHLSQ